MFKLISVFCVLVVSAVVVSSNQNQETELHVTREGAWDSAFTPESTAKVSRNTASPFGGVSPVHHKRGDPQNRLHYWGFHGKRHHNSHDELPALVSVSQDTQEVADDNNDDNNDDTNDSQYCHVSKTGPLALPSSSVRFCYYTADTLSVQTPTEFKDIAPQLFGDFTGELPVVAPIKAIEVVTVNTTQLDNSKNTQQETQEETRVTETSLPKTAKAQQSFTLEELKAAAEKDTPTPSLSTEEFGSELKKFKLPSKEGMKALHLSYSFEHPAPIPAVSQENPSDYISPVPVEQSPPSETATTAALQAKVDSLEMKLRALEFNLRSTNANTVAPATAPNNSNNVPEEEVVRVEPQPVEEVTETPTVEGEQNTETTHVVREREVKPTMLKKPPQPTKSEEKMPDFSEVGLMDPLPKPAAKPRHALRVLDSPSSKESVQANTETKPSVASSEKNAVSSDVKQEAQPRQQTNKVQEQQPQESQPQEQQQQQPQPQVQEQTRQEKPQQQQTQAQEQEQQPAPKEQPAAREQQTEQQTEQPTKLTVPASTQKQQQEKEGHPMPENIGLMDASAAARKQSASMDMTVPNVPFAKEYNLADDSHNNLADDSNNNLATGKEGDAAATPVREVAMTVAATTADDGVAAQKETEPVETPLADDDGKETDANTKDTKPDSKETDANTKDTKPDSKETDANTKDTETSKKVAAVETEMPLVADFDSFPEPTGNHHYAPNKDWQWKDLFATEPPAAVKKETPLAPNNAVVGSFMDKLDVLLQSTAKAVAPPRNRQQNLVDAFISTTSFLESSSSTTPQQQAAISFPTTSGLRTGAFHTPESFGWSQSATAQGYSLDVPTGFDSARVFGTFELKDCVSSNNPAQQNPVAVDWALLIKKEDSVSAVSHGSFDVDDCKITLARTEKLYRRVNSNSVALSLGNDSIVVDKCEDGQLMLWVKPNKTTSLRIADNLEFAFSNKHNNKSHE